VDGYTVGERAVKTLESVNVPLETGEVITHFLVAAGAGLAQIPDGCGSLHVKQRGEDKHHLRLGKSGHSFQNFFLLTSAARKQYERTPFIKKRRACLSMIALTRRPQELFSISSSTLDPDRIASR
jgi:hypothetical protein